MILIPVWDSKFQNLYSSDYNVDTTLRPKLIVNFYNYSTRAILENNDDIALLNNEDKIMDYLAWGSNPGTDDNAAVAVNQWVDNSLF